MSGSVERYNYIVTMLEKYTNHLMTDVIIAQAHLESTDIQFFRRVYIRCLFAYIEGFIYCWQLILLKYLQEEDTVSNNKMFLSLPDNKETLESYFVFPQQILALQEISYEVNKDGLIKSSGYKFIKLDSKVLFVANMINGVFELDLKVNQIKHWDAFLRCIDVRNNVTHPKTYESFQINDINLKDIYKAKEWFNSFRHQILSVIEEALYKLYGS